MTASLSFRHHPRDGGRYVYAVLSRRAGGISLGVNLNPDKHCSFDCVYCQVDRSETVSHRIDTAVLEAELRGLLSDARDGQVSARARAQGTPPGLARVVELAIAGDGEPTAARQFPGLVTVITRSLRSIDPTLPLVLFTNATTFHLPPVARGLAALEAAGGRVLAKLDAGTTAGYAAVDRSRVPFERVIDNLRTYADRAPLWIQSMFVELDGHPPLPTEVDAYVEQLEQIDARRHGLAGIEVGTIARAPAVLSARPLSVRALETIASKIRARLPDVPVQIVPGAAGQLSAV